MAGSIEMCCSSAIDLRHPTPCRRGWLRADICRSVHGTCKVDGQMVPALDGSSIATSTKCGVVSISLSDLSCVHCLGIAAADLVAGDYSLRRASLLAASSIC